MVIGSPGAAVVGTQSSSRSHTFSSKLPSMKSKVMACAEDASSYIESQHESLQDSRIGRERSESSNGPHGSPHKKHYRSARSGVLATLSPSTTFVSELSHETVYDHILRPARASMTVAMMRLMPERREGVIYQWRMCVFRLLCWQPFDYCIGLVIVLNSIVVGIDQTLRLQGKDVSIIYIFEQCFLFIYTIELALRFFASGVKCFGDSWLRFDILLVALGLASFVADMWAINADELGPLMVLRIGRLVRLARTARLLIQFRELWIMIRGLMTSLGTMIYTLLLLIIILYVFSCISIELVTPQGNTDDETVKEIVDYYFSSLPQTMLTFLQFVCLDSVAQIYKPLIEHEPWLVVFFVCIILIVSIVLMNLVTAVVVNGAFETAQQDRDALAIYEQQQKRRMIEELRMIFARVDEDGSGHLSTDEILDIADHDLELIKHLTSMDDPMDIIHMLDVDGDGHIGIDEFLNGLWTVVVSKVPPEMRLELKKIQRLAKEQSDELFNAIQSLNAEIGKLRSGARMMERPSDFSASVGLPLDRNAEVPIPEDTPAWARLMIAELRDFRKGCFDFQPRLSDSVNLSPVYSDARMDDSICSNAQVSDPMAAALVAMSSHIHLLQDLASSSETLRNKLLTVGESLQGMSRIDGTAIRPAQIRPGFSHSVEKSACAPLSEVGGRFAHSEDDVEKQMLSEVAGEDEVRPHGASLHRLPGPVDFKFRKVPFMESAGRIQ